VPRQNADDLGPGATHEVGSRRSIRRIRRVRVEHSDDVPFDAQRNRYRVLAGIRQIAWLTNCRLATDCRHPRPRRTCDQPSIVVRNLDGPGIGRVG
jgi:hypothetical protein